MAGYSVMVLFDSVGVLPSAMEFYEVESREGKPKCITIVVPVSFVHYFRM